MIRTVLTPCTVINDLKVKQKLPYKLCKYCNTAVYEIEGWQSLLFDLTIDYQNYLENIAT